MRCSCKACGTYMVQRERGLESGCRCPACGNACRDCMGSVSGPLRVEALQARYGDDLGETFLPKGEEELRERAERPPDWRRLL